MRMDMKTVYLFYEKYDKGPGNDRLYAYTTVKKLAEEFKAQRNMNHFIYEKTRMEDDYFKNFKFHYAKLRLIWMNLITKDCEHGRFVAKKVKTLGTVMEEEHIFVQSDRCINEFMKTLNRYVLSIADDKVINALHLLKYYDFDAMHYRWEMKPAPEFYAGLIQYDTNEQRTYMTNEQTIGFHYDQLALFVYWFGHMLKVVKEDD